MVDYTSLRAMTNRLILANGRSFIVRKLDKDSNTPSTPWRHSEPRSTPEWSATVVGVFIEPSTFRRYGFNIEISDDLIKRVESIVLIPAAQFLTTIDPAEADEFLDDNIIWRIEFNRLLAPGDTQLMWVMGGRR